MHSLWFTWVSDLWPADVEKARTSLSSFAMTLTISSAFRINACTWESYVLGWWRVGLWGCSCVNSHFNIQAPKALRRSQCRSPLSRACYFVLRNGVWCAQREDISSFFSLFPPASCLPKLWPELKAAFYGNDIDWFCSLLACLCLN